LKDLELSIMNAFVRRVALAACFAATGAVVGAMVTHPQATGAASDAGFRAAARPPVSVAAAAPDFSALVEANKAAVVSITSEGMAQAADDEEQAGPFPGMPLPFPFRMPQPQAPTPRVGLGSGFVIGEDGYILTNHHVVADAQRVTVKLADRRELPAKVIGSDPLADVALLKIDASGLTTVNIGESDKLKVGQWVLAIGAPFGLDYTATQGIISALGRSLPSESYVPFIQTDAAVNPGNSGGPLFDASGRVIGINSQIYSRTGGFMGLSFAIPIDVAMEVAHQLKTTGKVARGWLGVTVQAVNQELARSFDMPQPRGALVAEAKPGTPAANAGIRTGDVILSYNGMPVPDSGDLAPLVGRTRPGTRVPITVLRAGAERRIEATVGELPDASGAIKVAQASGEQGRTGFNLMVSDLSPRQRQELGVQKGGVLVEGVGPGAAAAAGVQPGDVLLRLNQEEIRDTAHLKRLVQALPANRPAALLVKRGDAALYMAIDPRQRG
jgi:serine protease Do